MSAHTDLRNKVMLVSADIATLFKNNTGVAFTKEGVPVRYGLLPGSSDIIGITHVNDIGIFTAIEIKTGGGIPSKEQRVFLERVAELGGIAILGRDANDVRDILRAATRGEKVWGRVHGKMSGA